VKDQTLAFMLAEVAELMELMVSMVSMDLVLLLV
jgi:hypothetical protein